MDNPYFPDRFKIKSTRLRIDIEIFKEFNIKSQSEPIAKLNNNSDNNKVPSQIFISPRLELQ